MKLFEQIDRLLFIHKHIKAAKTGTPSCFAKSLNISTRRLYSIIDEMKSLGAPIAYSRTSETYYYKEEFDFDIAYSFRTLSHNEESTISAGKGITLGFTAFFVH